MKICLPAARGWSAARMREQTVHLDPVRAAKRISVPHRQVVRLLGRGQLRALASAAVAAQSKRYRRRRRLVAGRPPVHLEAGLFELQHHGVAAPSALFALLLIINGLRPLRQSRSTGCPPTGHPEASRPGAPVACPEVEIPVAHQSRTTRHPKSPSSCSPALLGVVQRSRLLCFEHRR